MSVLLNNFLINYPDRCMVLFVLKYLKSSALKDAKKHAETTPWITVKQIKGLLKEKHPKEIWLRADRYFLIESILENVRNNICSHSVHFHDAMQQRHGKIPHTDETYVYVHLVIHGAMALRMIGFDMIDEIYVLILKNYVPKCYNISDLVESVIDSMQNVKKPNYTAIQQQILLNRIRTVRKANAEDLGLKCNLKSKCYHADRANRK